MSNLNQLVDLIKCYKLQILMIMFQYYSAKCLHCWFCMIITGNEPWQLVKYSDRICEVWIHSKNIKQLRCKFFWVQYTGSPCRIHLKQDLCLYKPWMHSFGSDASLWGEKARINIWRGVLFLPLLPLSSLSTLSFWLLPFLSFSVSLSLSVCATLCPFFASNHHATMPSLRLSFLSCDV